jgi:hypothetical protein
MTPDATGAIAVLGAGAVVSVAMAPAAELVSMLFAFRLEHAAARPSNSTTEQRAVNLIDIFLIVS